VLKRSLAGLVKHNVGELTALAKTRLRRMPYRPGLLEGCLGQLRAVRLLSLLLHRSPGSDLVISAASTTGLSLS
jgi:hypothetical protein